MVHNGFVVPLLWFARGPILLARGVLPRVSVLARSFSNQITPFRLLPMKFPPTARRCLPNSTLRFSRKPPNGANLVYAVFYQPITNSDGGVQVYTYLDFAPPFSSTNIRITWSTHLHDHII